MKKVAETASNGRHARGDCLVSDDGRSESKAAL